MKNLAIVFFAFVTLLLTSCDANIFNDNCLEEEGAIVTQIVELDELKGLHLSIPAKVTFKEAATQEIEIRSTQNVIDEILDDSRMLGTTWNVKTDKDCVRLENTIEISISVPTFSQIESSGAAEIQTEGAFSDIEQLVIDISGASELDLTIENLQFLSLKASGGSKITLAGDAKRSDLDFNGSVKLDAFGMVIEELDIAVSGAVEGEVTVEKDLMVTISGAGKVCYKGNPTITTDISGAGELNDCN